jgi:hypothetical protein
MIAQRTGGPGGPRPARPGTRPEVGVVGREPRIDAGGLGAREGAHAVDQQTAGADQWDGGAHQAPLEVGEAGDVVGLEAPAGVGSAPQDAEARARRVHEHPVEAPRPPRCLEPVGDDGGDVVRAELAGVGGDHAGPSDPDVTGDDQGRRGLDTGQGGSLPAGSGAEVEDALPRPGPDVGGDHLAAEVLDVAVGPFGDLGGGVHHFERGSGQAGPEVRSQ